MTSSETQQRLESLQREFSAYVDHITNQAPKAKAEKAKQEVVVAAPPVVAVESSAPKKRGRKLKVDDASVAC